MMQVAEIKHNLKTNPFFALEIVVDNNPQAVASNVANFYGQLKEYTTDQLKDLLFQIIDNGTPQEQAQVWNALKVRWIPENASASLNAAYNSIFDEAQFIKATRNANPSLGAYQNVKGCPEGYKFINGRCEHIV
jgi:hypothetical protein